jgi:hypothetical protein
MTNSDNGGSFLQHAFAAIADAHSWPDYPENIVEPDQPDAATLSTCAGTYRLREGFDFTAEPVGLGLEVAFAGQRPLVFMFAGRTDANALQFASMATDTVFRLAEDDAGRTITFVQNGAEIVCLRVSERVGTPPRND